jgi:hypothetical protein
MDDGELLEHILFGARLTGPALERKLRASVDTGVISPQRAQQVRDVDAPFDPHAPGSYALGAGFDEPWYVVGDRLVTLPADPEDRE